MADESPLQKNKRTIFGSQKGKDYAFSISLSETLLKEITMTILQVLFKKM